MKIYTLWNNMNLEKNLEEYKKNFSDEEIEAYSEEELLEKLEEENDFLLSDLHYELDIQLNEPILVIAKLGLWNGTAHGFKEIESGNIKDCLNVAQGDYVHFYLDKNGDFCADDVHHDGVNHYTFRAFKKDTSLTQRENLENKIYHNTVTRRDITRTTDRLGDYIAKVYGIEIPNQKSFIGKE